MNPVNFPEANHTFGPPADLVESQCMSVPAHVSIVRGGSVDGTAVVVVAWKPDAIDMERLQSGEPIYLSMLGGLAPHFLTTRFEYAIKPA